MYNWPNSKNELWNGLNAEILQKIDIIYIENFDKKVKYSMYYILMFFVVPFVTTAENRNILVYDNSLNEKLI